MTNQTILNWVNQNKDKKSETEVKDELLKQGWKLEDINDALDVAFGRKTEAQQAQPAQPQKVQLRRTGEIILGVLGGMIGLIGAIIVLLFGGLGAAFEAEGASEIISLGWVALPLAILGIVGGAIASANAKLAGVFMLISGVGGLIAISLGYIVAAPLLIIGGIMALVRRPKKI